MLKKYKMWIGGKWVDATSGKTYKVVNPATEEEITQLPLGEKADADKAVEAAQKAFPVWSQKSPEERSRILKEIAALIRKHTQELIDMDIRDHGSPVGLASVFARVIPMHFENAAELSKTIIGRAEMNLMPGLIPYLQREPIGVVACIVPWNIPLMIAAKIAASLATGNTCVAKPPSVDSIGAVQIAEIMAEHPDLPPGAVNVVTGPGSTVGEALSSHPGVGMVAFTGSCETGKRIMELASKTVKRLFLELGGKNPFIVLEDADLDITAAGAADALFFNTGMLCGAPGRFYIPEKLHNKFVEKFIALARNVVVGDPNDKKTQMGPVVSAEHRDRVENFIRIGVKEGAKLVYGGKRPTEAPLNRGYYVKPAVFTDVTQHMTLAREEIFGPVAVMMKYSSEDEVINLANDNTFGLAASVWTRDQEKAMKFANAIQSGMVWVNTHNAGGGLPWGGFKESGFGKEGGIHGLKEYTQLKGICINLVSSRKATL
jgi:acyl-CoA reductase-like NAD-dependent aldehyde dehydrogenase